MMLISTVSKVTDVKLDARVTIKNRKKKNIIFVRSHFKEDFSRVTLATSYNVRVGLQLQPPI